MVLVALLSITRALVAGYTSHPNVLLITIDTLRADYLSCYNAAAAPTPNIDRLAAKGVLFTRAYSLIPITMPSHSAILSSHPPEELSVFNNGDHYSSEWPLLPDFLSSARYHSAAFVSLEVLRGSFGFAPHFNWYEDTFDRRNYKLASEMNALALPWIEKEKRNRFFAWIHYSDPHEPYVTADAPDDTEITINGSPYGKYCFGKRETLALRFTAHPGENTVEIRSMTKQGTSNPGSLRYVEKRMTVSYIPGLELEYGPSWNDFVLPNGVPARFFDSLGTLTIINHNASPVPLSLFLPGGVRGQSIKDARKNYASEVQFVDRYIGQLLKKLIDLDLEKKTIVVLTADHGEGLKTHQYMNHINCLYNETIHVPLIIYDPRIGHRRQRVDQMVNHLDIVPTILDLLNIQAANQRGRSLKRYIRFAPGDRLIAREPDPAQTFSCTYAAQAVFNSFCVVHGQTKLIHVPKRGDRKWEMYDLAQDPAESHDLLMTSPSLIDSPAVTPLRRALEKYREDAESSQQKHRNLNPQIDERDREMLRHLGYVQ